MGKRHDGYGLSELRLSVIVPPAIAPAERIKVRVYSLKELLAPLPDKLFWIAPPAFFNAIRQPLIVRGHYEHRFSGLRIGHI